MYGGEHIGEWGDRAVKPYRVTRGMGAKSCRWGHGDTLRCGRQPEVSEQRTENGGQYLKKVRIFPVANQGLAGAHEKSHGMKPKQSKPKATPGKQTKGSQTCSRYNIENAA